MKAPSKSTAKADPKKSGSGKAEPKKAAAKKSVPKKLVAKKAIPKKAIVKQLTKLAPFLPQPAAQPQSGAAVLDRLFAVITERRAADPARSHSARLLSRGMPKVAQKFGEEAVECLIEAVSGNADALVAESADVLYHLLVMWVAAGVAPDQVWAELVRREGVSGIAEKALRAKPFGTTKIP